MRKLTYTEETILHYDNLEEIVPVISNLSEYGFRKDDKVQVTITKIF